MKKQLTGILVLTGLVVTATGCFQTTSFRSGTPPDKKTADQNIPPPARPLLTVPQTIYTFPSARNNMAYVFTFTNASSERASGLTVTKTFPSNTFTVESENCGSVIEPGSSCSLAVNYSTTLTQPQTGYITLNYLDRNGIPQSPLLITLQGPSSAPPPPPAGGGSGSAPPPPAPTPTPPPVTGPFVISSNFTTQKSNARCGQITLRDVCNYATPSTFDGANCWVGSAPSWTTRAWYGGKKDLFGKEIGWPNFYYQPQSGRNTDEMCGAPNRWDGANCMFSTANGPNPRVGSGQFSKNYYFDPGTRTVDAVWQADCPLGSSFDGNSCLFGTAPRAVATVELKSCDWAGNNCTGGVFSYPPSGDNTPCGSNWYDTNTGKCQVATIPAGVRGSIWRDVNFYMEPRNKVCVEQ